MTILRFSFLLTLCCSFFPVNNDISSAFNLLGLEKWTSQLLSDLQISKENQTSEETLETPVSTVSDCELVDLEDMTNEIGLF